jgi:hypothetical protein
VTQPTSWLRLGLLLAVTGCAAGPTHDALVAENARLKRALAEKHEGKRSGEAADAATENGRDARHEAEWANYRFGDMNVGWGRSADLGWASMRVRSVKPCDDGNVGVEVEIANHGTDSLRFSKYSDVTVRGADGNKATTGYNFGKGCGEELADVIEGGATVRGWLFYSGTPSQVRLLDMDLKEPHGLAKATLRFALAADVELPPQQASALPKRGPAPAERIGEPAETPFYRVTVTGVRLCGSGRTPDGETIVGIEIAAENFSNVPLTFGEGGTLKDARGYAYTNGEMSWDGGCTPRLTRTAVPPGEKVRGWLFPFNVAADSEALVLQYSVQGEGWSSSTVSLPVGALPARADKAALTWKAPAQKTASGADYTLSLTDMRVCYDDGNQRYIGVEVLIKNRSQLTLTAGGAAEIADSEGYRFHGENVDLGADSPCKPVISYEDVKPGDKLRGWLYFFRVPAKSQGLELHYTLSFEGDKKRHDVDVTLALGELQ